MARALSARCDAAKGICGQIEWSNARKHRINRMMQAKPINWRKMISRIVVAVLIVGAMVVAKIWYDTMRDPVVERLVVESDALEVGQAPMTIVLMADIHVAGPDMPPSRLAKIVDKVNALKPDLVAIAGDLVSEKLVATRHYSAADVVAPLGGLKAPLGVVVVPGNHDHWSGWDALKTELARYPQITVLQNAAAQFGPLAIGGSDDPSIDRADNEATFGALKPLKGAKIVLTHSPDIFPQVPVDVDLVLAGHTHCGQIAWPWGGSPATISDYGELYACGVVKQHGKVLVTSAGLGTTLLPMRMFTRPEVWLIEIRPTKR